MKSWILYIVAILITIVPISIVMITGNAFNSYQSKIFINIALICIILGKAITLKDKKKGDKTIQRDIGVIIALLIVLIFAIVN